jgi:hypothetical protein
VIQMSVRFVRKHNQFQSRGRVYSCKNAFWCLTLDDALRMGKFHHAFACDACASEHFPMVNSIKEWKLDVSGDFAIGYLLSATAVKIS